MKEMKMGRQMRGRCVGLQRLERKQKQAGHKGVPFFSFFINLKLKLHLIQAFSLYKTIALHRNKS